MSQNLDATAINQIHALISAQGVNEIISKIGADAVALPENFRIHDLEKFNLNRFRFRGALSTASIDDFTRYSKDLADEGTRCFIDADNMRAVSVLNLGTIDEPGHADNTATLKLKKTAPFSALLSVNGERNSQKSLAEWIEDWADYLVGFDANGDAIQATKAAAAVRKITIEANQTADFEDNDFSGKRSLMESVEAKTKDIMPVAFEFKLKSGQFPDIPQKVYSSSGRKGKMRYPTFYVRLFAPAITRRHQPQPLSAKTITQCVFSLA